MTSPPRRPGDRLWIVWILIGVIVGGAYLTFGERVVWVFTPFGLGTSILLFVGPRWHGVKHRVPFDVLGIAVLFFLLGVGLRQDVERPGVVPVDAFFTFLGYVGLLTGTGMMVKRYWVGRRSLNAALDAALVMIGATALSLAIFTVPAATFQTRPWWLNLLYATDPMMDVLFLLMQVTLSVTTAVRLTSWRLMLVGLLFLAFGDEIYAWYTAQGPVVVEHWMNAPFLVTMAFVGAAMLHPSIRGFNDVRMNPVHDWSHKRVALLAAAVTLCPLSILLGHADGGPGRVIVATGCLLSAVVLIFRSVAAVRALAKAQTVLERRARQDTLTGLGNRDEYSAVTARLLASQRPPETVTVLLVDIDGLRFVNDSFSSRAGDELLMAIAARLQQSCCPESTVTRVHGEEFAITVPDIERGHRGEDVAKRVQATFASPLRLSAGRFDASVSIGMVNSADQSSPTPDLMLRDAAAAMYEAKTIGRGHWLRFNTDTAREAKQRSEIESALRSAVENEQFCVLYQPTARLETHQIVFREAQLRWNHPQLGNVPQAAFLAVAEEFGLLRRIGDFVLRQAVEEMARDPRPVRVKISESQLYDESFPDRVEALLAAHQVGPDKLYLQVSESALAARPSLPVGLQQLLAKGVGLVLDSFGTSGGSLAALRHTSPNALVLGRQFSSRQSRGTEQAVRAAVAVARIYDAEVIATGVDSLEQAQQLALCGVAYGQGELFGPAAAGTAVVPVRRVAVR